MVSEQSLPIHFTKPRNIEWRFAILWFTTLKIGPLANLSFLFTVACSTFVLGYHAHLYEVLHWVSGG